MRIVLISDYGRLMGGAETTVANLREEFRRRGHEVRWFASTAGGRALRFEADERCLGTTSRWRTVLQTWNPWAAWALRRTLKSFRPDVVHVTMFLTQLSPAILAVLRGWPVVWHAMWYRGVCPTGLKWLPREAQCRYPWGIACYREGCLPSRDWLLLMIQMHWWWQNRAVIRRIVVESDAVRRMLEEHGFVVMDKIAPGVRERPMRPPLGTRPVIAYAGRLTKEKGVEVLMAALREVPSAEGWIVGDGPERAALEQLVRQWQLDDRVKFFGHLAREEAERLLEQAWVQVVPSLWAEPFGLVAVEAAMRGTVVVASATGGLVETVEHERTGLLVPPGNVQELARALGRLLRSRELLEQWGVAAHERASKHFGIPRAAEQWEGVYARVIENCANRARTAREHVCR
ncbi:MAG: glycosyltransferase family 4 protein [Verrucomicrobiae bacterium]|nr:glycosyltransferase family 4 protein [Verrucomicrobiae bacterium]MDW8343032.1 glycosyltransferase family 4 protein [Verrucomicrobiae bacterium]